MSELLASPPLLEAAALISDAQQQDFMVREADAVHAYLARRPGAQSIIRPAVDAARRIMGDGVQLSLEIYRDPELGGEQLSLYVRSDTYTDDFLERLQEVAKAVRSLRAGKDDRFLVTSDFQPPR